MDIDQHPTKMVTLLPAVAMFMRGDVNPAKEAVVVKLGKEQEWDALRKSQARSLVNAGTQDVPGWASLVYRIAIATDEKKVPGEAIQVNQLKLIGDRFVSSTGELVWDLTEKGRGVVTVNARSTKAVIGYGGGKRFELGDVVIEPGETIQEGWSAITVTIMEGEDIYSARSLLITATGYVENTKMGWKNKEKSSVGRDWGERPSLVEGVPAKITLPFPANRIQAWSLDERGHRKDSILIQEEQGGKAIIIIGPQWKTLWYEVTVGNK